MARWFSGLTRHLESRPSKHFIGDDSSPHSIRPLGTADGSGTPLRPPGEDRCHGEIADELIASVDAEQLHALLCKQRRSELHGGHEAKPNVEANGQADMQAHHSHLM